MLARLAHGEGCALLAIEEVTGMTCLAVVVLVRLTICCMRNTVGACALGLGRAARDGKTTSTKKFKSLFTSNDVRALGTVALEEHAACGLSIPRRHGIDTAIGNVEG